MASPELPRHLRQIVRRTGDQWADTPHFSVVINWLNATPGAPQPPLRYLLHLTFLYLAKQNAQDVPDRLQWFWYDRSNGYQMRVRGSYQPGEDAQPDIDPFFWGFLISGLRAFCTRTAWEENKRQTRSVVDSETGAAREERVQFVPIESEGPDGTVSTLNLVDDDPEHQPEAALLRNVPSETLQKAVIGLNPQQRRVLDACLADEDRDTAAARLGIKKNNLNVMFLRIKRLLREALDQDASDCITLEHPQETISYQGARLEYAE